MIFDVIRELRIWFGDKTATLDGDGVPGPIKKAMAKAEPDERLKLFLSWAKKESIDQVRVNGGTTDRVIELINILTPVHLNVDCVVTAGLIAGLAPAVAARLQSLTLKNVEPELDLAGLERLSKLESLVLEAYVLDPTRLKKAPASLTSLGLKSSRPLDLTAVVIPSSVQTLELSSQETITLPRNAPSLQALSVFVGQGIISGLERVAGMTTLEKLNLHCNPGGKVALQKLSALRSLRLMGVASTGLSSLRLLQSVQLDEPLELKELKDAAELEELTIPATASSDFSPLAPHGKLRVLSLGEDFKPSLKQLAPLQGRSIELRDCRLGETVDKAIAKLGGKRAKKPAVGKKAKQRGSVAETWDAFHSWLEENDAGAEFQKGASAKSLEKLKKRFPGLPASFLESWARHDGDDESGGFAGWSMMALSEIASEYEFWINYKVASPPPSDDKRLAKTWWDAGWVPFASSGGGDFLAIDTSKKGGGQVVLALSDPPMRKVLGPSFEAWFGQLVGALESGKIEWGNVDELFDV